MNWKKTGIVSFELALIAVGVLAEAGVIHPLTFFNAPQPKACFYEDTAFKGKSICLTAGRQFSNLTYLGFEDQISSVEVSGDTDVVAYTEPSFAGSSLTLHHSVANVGDYGKRWRDSIISLKVIDRNYCLRHNEAGDGSFCFPRAVAEYTAKIFKK